MKKIALVIASAVAALGFMVTPAFAGDMCDVYEGPDKEIVCGSHTEDDAQNKIGTILNAVFGITGIVAAIVIVIGGVFYVTSQGDPGKVTRAKSTILYAVIGLIISLLAFAIVNFILGAMK